MKIISKIIKIWSYLMVFFVLLTICGIFVYFAIRSRKVISLSYIFDTPRGMILGEEGGIFPAIIGSIYFSLTAVLVAIIPAISTAVFISFYAKNKTKIILQLIIENIASVPSIVFGLFVYTLFVYKLKFGRCIFSSGVALSLMVLPFMEKGIEKSFNEIDKNTIIASKNLGISNSYMFWNLIIKMTYKEIIANVLLCFCFAMGALAPMIFTGAVAFSAVPTSIFKPSMALPMHLYLQIAQGADQLDRAYATAFIELIVLLITNGIGFLLIMNKNKKVV